MLLHRLRPVAQLLARSSQQMVQARIAVLERREQRAASIGFTSCPRHAPLHAAGMRCTRPRGAP